MTETTYGYLVSMRKLKRLHSPERAERSPEGLVLAHGREWPWRPKPARYRMGMPRACFMNTLRLARRSPRLTYCEGFAATPLGANNKMFAVHHAWLLTPEGFVLDTTWPDGSGYWGIPLRTEFVHAVVVRSGFSSVLYSREVADGQPAAYLRPLPWASAEPSPPGPEEEAR